MPHIILETRSLTKRFGGVLALHDVNLTVNEGEIHAICGENGAGKSTLIKILSGVHPAGSYDGEFLLRGRVQRFRSTRDAEAAGIAVIHQELALVPELSVGENIFLGHEPQRLGVIDWNDLAARSRRVLEELHLKVDSQTPVKQLGIGEQQLVEIAKALVRNADIMILDEPTAALAESEVDTLLSLLRDLKRRGMTIIYISHKLKEILSLAERVSVLRDGRLVATTEVARTDEGELISMMVGRAVGDLFPKETHRPDQPILEVQNLTLYDPAIPDRKRIANVSFSVCRGEVVGIAGLMGAGRTELLTGIFGAYPGRREGEIRINGRPVDIESPQDAIKAGLALVSEDRKRYGLLLDFPLSQNLTLAGLEKVSSRGVINQAAEISIARGFVNELRIRASSVESPVNALSGGNQQKVVLAKWLLTEPRVLFLDEPTRGIDVGAKQEIYHLMNRLAKQGLAIVMVSSELEEVLGMCDRILVLHQGRITAEFCYGESDLETVMRYATGAAA
jgi:D-xylose transport system ATP-binding protein